MSKAVILALASAATALATAAAAVAEELSGEVTGKPTAGTPAPEAGTTEDPAPRRRGRPPGASAATTETPAAPEGKTEEELREVIRPLVEEGRGEEVKKVIAKYGTALKTIPADKHAEFVKDIDALKY